MSYIIKIKNTDTISHTWGGRLFAASEEYTLESGEEKSFKADTTFMSDVSGGIATVGNGSEYFDAIKGWDYLIGIIPHKVERIAVADPNGKRARLVGTHSSTAVANTTTKVDWLIPQLTYAGQNMNSVFDGIQYYAKDSNMGDKLDFLVIDKDGTGVTLGLYPQAYYDAYKDVNGELVVEQFGDGWYVAPNSLEDIILYKAALLTGLYIRASYTNTHASNDVSFFCNLFRHLD